MAEQATTIISSVAGPASSYAVISRTTTQDMNGNINHNHIHNTHITSNGHHKYPSNINVIHRQSSISTSSTSSSSSPSSHIQHSQSYHVNTSHVHHDATHPTTQEIKHLTLSVTPTSVSSNSSCSTFSTNASPKPNPLPHTNTPNDTTVHHRTTTPPHLISKSYQNPHRSPHQYHVHHNHNHNHNRQRFNSDPHRNYPSHGYSDQWSRSNHVHRSHPNINNNNNDNNGTTHSTSASSSYNNNNESPSSSKLESNTNKCKSSIISRTVLQLIELGINPSTIRWPNIMMQSHEYIAILTSGCLNIIDTMNKKVILTQQHCTASSAMVNPQNNHNIHHLQLLAMRNKNMIKVMSLMEDDEENDQMMIEHKVKDEDILFWRWLDSEIIAFITTKSVYHWIPTLTQSKSKCILTLSHPNHVHNTFIQYINYDQSKDGNYIFVQGLTQSASDNKQPNSGVDGVLTLYDIHNNILQPTMNAFGGCFASLSSFKGITLFCYTKKEYIDRERGSVTKLYIVELSRNRHGCNNGHNDDDEHEEKERGHKYHIRVERTVEFYHTNDFVVSMVQCQSVLYAVTKLGCLLIFDISSGTNLYNQKVSRDVIFLVTPFPKSNGIVALDRTGKLTLYYLNKSEFSHIPHLLPNKNVSVLSYNVYNNSFAIKYKDTYYESSFYLNASCTPGNTSCTPGNEANAHEEDRLLCIGHVKMVLIKALHVEHIGYCAISRYNIDGTTVLLENNCILTEDMRFIKIEINKRNEIIDKSFGKIYNFYHMNYGIPMDIIQELLSENLFNYHCNELKIFTMNFLLNKNNNLMGTIQVLEKKIGLLNGEGRAINNLSTDELCELEQNVNDSYRRIRTFIRGKFKCCVCYEKDKHILFKPCHHYVVCVECADKLIKCPVCNTDINQKIKIYQ